MNGLVLHAVVQVSEDSSASWVTASPRPWPAFVRLHAGTAPDDIALVVHVLSVFNALPDSPPLGPAELSIQSDAVLPGGLAAVSKSGSIFPSLGCDLDEWGNWFSLLDGARRPWLGHPSPFVQATAEGFVLLHGPGADDEPPARATAIRFTREQLTAALNEVGRDLREFLKSLRAWCDVAAPEHASGIVSACARSCSIAVEGETSWHELRRRKRLLWSLFLLYLPVVGTVGVATRRYDPEGIGAMVPEASMAAKISVSLDKDVLSRIDRLVREGVSPSRSEFAQGAILEKLARLDRRRLRRECAKLDARAEQALADEGLSAQPRPG